MDKEPFKIQRHAGKIKITQREYIKQEINIFKKLLEELENEETRNQ